MSLQSTQQSTAYPSVDSLHISVEHTHQKLLPSLLALTNDRIEADHIKIQPVLLHLIQRLQHLTFPVFSDAITTADKGKIFVSGIF